MFALAQTTQPAADGSLWTVLLALLNSPIGLTLVAGILA